MNGAPKLNFSYSSPKDYDGDQKQQGAVESDARIVRRPIIVAI